MKKLTPLNLAENKILKDISAVIKKSETFFIAGHRKPDGDALGSGLALASLLRRLGKKVTHCSVDEISQDLKFMPGSKAIKITNKIDKIFD
uniref:DHH family phosphoesterase n=1 Tax=Candidatus Ruminimicrobium bovinum TaxID=3242779 RepID=UPI0039B90F89